ncbi:hypothetical protein E4N62_38285 [Streptomyces sp. MNU76]|uniref:hypothetical protein n=1 Tax=Streptomyces sp. MNU76 TaxID=2560026 RepID=UPI001E427744|nr:hypothetical protein [Streptomyces sp. MNU76]MCC9710575.1 hypothetical protein [Streptomyces sp. MNU76]
MVVWEVVRAAVQFTAGHLTGKAFGPLGLALLVTVLVAVRVGRERLSWHWWAALFFVLLMVQA